MKNLFIFITAVALLSACKALTPDEMQNQEKIICQMQGYGSTKNMSAMCLKYYGVGSGNTLFLMR